MKKFYRLLIVMPALLCLIHSVNAQTITLGTPSATGPYCTGTSLSLPFTVSTPFGATQIFNAELSSATGNFAGTPIIIGTLSGNSSGTIPITIPVTTIPASLYAIRIKATPSAVISNTITNVTVNGTPVFTAGATSTRCAGPGAVPYGATSSGITSITYSLAPSTAGSINATTGTVNYSGGFTTGTATITAITAAGCSASHIATTTNPVTTPVFAMGATSTRCQGTGTVTYSATSPGSAGITYSLVTGPLDTSTIDAVTGAVIYSPGFAGTATITATAAGCTGPNPKTASHVVTVIGTPVFAAGATSTRCQGATTVTYTATSLGSTGITYSLSPLSAGTINATTGAVSYSAGFTTGTAIITATTATGCSATHTATTTIPISTPVFALGATSTRCQGNSPVTYSATSPGSAGITYSLVTSALDTSTIDTATGAVIYSPGFAGTATITATATGCTGPKTASHVVTVIGTPVFTAGATSTRCQGATTVTYTATSLGSTGITYSLAPASAGTIITTTGAVSYNAAFLGTAIITATTATGCSASHTATTTIPASTPVFAMGTTSTRCKGDDTVSYSATSTNSIGNITYSLTSTNLSQPLAPAPTIDTLGNVIYSAGYIGTVTITATATGCSGTISALHTAVVTSTIGTPVFALGATSSLCQGAAPVTYTATSTGSTGITYSLTPANAGTINTTTGAVTYSAGFAGAATITATATGCGSSVSTTHTATVTPTIGTPVFALGATSTLCQGTAPVTYTATSTGSTGITYGLAPANAGTINTTTGAVTYSAGFAGAATITAIATGCGGSKTASHTATVTPPIGTPVFALGATSTLCQGATPVTYTATSTGSTGITYSLTTNPVNLSTTFNTGTGAVTYSAGFVGTATIMATATGCGGPISATHTATVVPTIGTPVFALGATSTLCQGAAPVTYTATSAGSTGITYSLTPANAGTISTTTGAVTYSAGFAGAATITATATGCGGPAIATHTVTVAPTISTPVFASGAASTLCQGAAPVTYTATSAGSTGITYSLAPLSAGTISTAGTVTYSAGFAGTATIIASAAGCAGPKTASHMVTIVGTPVFNAGATSTRCQGFATVPYGATSINGTGIIYSLSTIPASSSTINASTGTVSYDPAFSGQATITATGSGCSSPLTATHTVTVAPGVGQVSFNSATSPTACQGSTVIYTATATNNSSISYSIVTTPLSGASINTSNGTVVYNPNFLGSAVVTAVATGCGSTTATQSVVITPDVTQLTFTAGPAQAVCQNPGTILYAATASNTTGPLSYSLSPAAAGTINPATGAVTYNTAFTGTATITVVATGCGSSLTATFPVTVTPTVGSPVFGQGSTSIRKQGAGLVSYAATATNSTGITYSHTQNSYSIDANNGNITYPGTFSGTDIITATATGCNGPRVATHSVTVVQTPVFRVGPSSVRCQGAGSVDYDANPSIGVVTYSLVTTPTDPATTINTATGRVTYSSTFAGSAIISAYRTLVTVVTDTAKHFVTVNVAPRLSSNTPNSKIICSGTNTAINLDATTGVGSTFTWTYTGGVNITGKSASPAGPGTTGPLAQLLTNTGNRYPDSLVYIVTAISPAPASCSSVINDNITVVVNPTPVLDVINPVTICSEQPVNIGLGASTPSTFSWSVSVSNNNITNASPGSGDTIRQTLNNIDVSINPVASSGTATYTITPTSQFFGCIGNAGTALVTVNPLPVVVFTTGASKTICSGMLTNIPLSANINSSFTFIPVTRTSNNLISGQGPGSGSPINQTLTNASDLAEDYIGYSVTPTTVSGTLHCIGKPSIIDVYVKPNPSISSNLTDSVCSDAMKEIQLKATIESTFIWYAGANPGNITGQTPGSGSSINLNLKNPSFDTAGYIEYIVIPTTKSLPQCVGNPKTLTIKVNPLPKLTSASTQTICSNGVLSYLPTSSTSGITQFTYDRKSSVLTIKNLDDIVMPITIPPFTIKDTLFTNYVLTPETVDYYFTLVSAAGCTLSNQLLHVTVNPTPKTPDISIFPDSMLCLGAFSMNFGASRKPDWPEYFKWTTTNADKPIQDTGNSRYALITFPNPGQATVTINAYVHGFSCESKPVSKTFTINNTKSVVQSVNVVKFGNNLVALTKGAKRYQWGFDQERNLEPVLLPGERSQNYYYPGIDTARNYYWVMVTFEDGCFQKDYYNQPSLRPKPNQPQAPISTEMKLYPNPVQDVLTLEVANAGATELVFDIYDLAGKRIYRVLGNGATTRIPVADLAPGCYLVACSQAGIRIATSRFIKN